MAGGGGGGGGANRRRQRRRRGSDSDDTDDSDGSDGSGDDDDSDGSFGGDGDALDVDHMTYEQLLALEEQMGVAREAGASSNRIQDLPTRVFHKVCIFWVLSISNKGVIAISNSTHATIINCLIVNAKL